MIYVVLYIKKSASCFIMKTLIQTFDVAFVILLSAFRIVLSHSHSYLIYRMIVNTTKRARSQTERYLESKTKDIK